MTQLHVNTKDFAQPLNPLASDSSNFSDIYGGTFVPTDATVSPQARASAGTALTDATNPSGADLFYSPRPTLGGSPAPPTATTTGTPGTMRDSGASTPGSGGMNPVFAQRLNSLIAASGGKLRITSGYRDEALQVKLFNEAVKKYGSEQAASQWVAKPQSLGGGGSNHTRGIAADLSGDLEWAHANAPRFGLYFPMSWENWHIEPVGSRDKVPPGAYTNDPNGQGINPTQDPNINKDPAVIAAHLSDALSAGPTPASINYHPQGGGAQQQPAAQGGAASTNFTPGGNGDVSSATKVYQALRAGGLDPQAAGALTAIAGRESAYNPSATNVNLQTQDDSHGLFQINLLHGGWGPFLQAHGIDPGSLNTFQGSIAAAIAIYNASGLHPWGGYKNMAWQNGAHLNDAVAASGGEVSLAQLEQLK